MFPKEAGVVVVGGGVLGTSAALHLAKSGVNNIVLLDRGPLASGTTPFAAGQVGYLSNTREAGPFQLYCITFFENFAQETGHTIDFRQNGSLRVVLDERHLTNLKRYQQAVHALGDKGDLISPTEAKQLVPDLQLDEAAGILHMPREGFIESPRTVASGFASGARDRGVAIHTHTHVTGIDVVDGNVRAVQTDRGTIGTPWVVVAAGAWTRQFTSRLGLDVKAIPVRHQAFVTAPLSAISPSQPIVRVVDPQVYIRPHAGGLLVGGYGFRPTSFDMNEFASGFEIPSLAADRIYYDRLKRSVEGFFPSLREATIVQERRGLPTVTPDAMLCVAESQEAKGLVVTAGCQVGGIARSPGVGRMVADIVTGQQTFAPPANLSLERFGDAYDTEAELRSRCEQVYGHLYWGIQ